MNNIRIINKNKDYYYDPKCNSYCVSNMEDLSTKTYSFFSNDTTGNNFYCLNNDHNDTQKCDANNKPNNTA